MGRINIEIPEEVHRNLRVQRAQTGIPIKELVVSTLEKQYGDVVDDDEIEIVD